MRWPFKPLDWLATFLPGIVMIVGAQMSKSAKGEDGLGVLLGAFLLAFPLSLAAGIFLAKGDGGKLKRCYIGVLLAIGLYFINCAFAAAGCAATGVFH